MLAKVDCILYDEMRAIVPAPRPRNANFGSGLWYFSLCAGTLEFLFLQFLTGTAKDQLLRDGLSDGRGRTMPVVLFCSGEEEQAFEEDLKLSPVTVEERHVHGLAHSVSKQDKEVVAFSRAVVERFIDWKARHS